MEEKETSLWRYHRKKMMLSWHAKNIDEQALVIVRGLPYSIEL